MVLEKPTVITDLNDRINAVINVYDQLGVKLKVESLQEFYFNKALKSVSSLSISDDKKQKLVLVANNLMQRTHWS